MSTVINLSLEGKSYKVLPRDIEFDSLSNQPLHVDFQTLSSNTKSASLDSCKVFK